MSRFAPNAVITIHRADGVTEHIPVLCEVRDGKIAPGPCYTREEWRSSTSADWEYDEDRGLLWQGQPGGPYNFAEYEIRLGEIDLGSEITDEQIEKLRDAAAQAGDHAMVLICDRALGHVVLDEDTTIESLRIAAFLSPRDKRRIASMSTDDCRDECARVISDAQAQAD